MGRPKGGGAARKPAVKAPQPERFSAKGTVEGVIRGKIKLKSTTDQIWIVNVGKGTEVAVKGEAAPETLSPRMWIRATMALDRRGRSKEPLTALTVISRREDTVVGVFPVQTAVGFDAPAPDPQAAKDPNATTDYDVVGVLSGMKKGKYTVKTQAGNQMVTIEFELAEDAKIDVNVDDYSLAKLGDEISVSGTVVKQAPGPVKPGEITGLGNATSVEIQLQEKIAPAKGKAKRVRKPSSSRTTQRGKKDDASEDKDSKDADARKTKKKED